jgi:hypothetical protein
MIKIGFIINFDYRLWYGGTNVIKNLICCIKKYSNNTLEPILFVRKSLDRELLKKEFGSIEIIKSDILDRGLFSRIYSKILILFIGRDPKLELYFKKHNIKLISHSNVFAYNFFTGVNSSIKCLSWITDFQHIYYPKYFTIRSIILRNLNIFFCIRHSSKILLSSYDSQNDLKKISKRAFDKSIVSQFYFEFKNRKDIITLSQLKKKFNIKSNFFFIPNQYWKHKNYEVVIESLFFLKKKNKLNNLLILSSGNNEDHRNKNYFSEIMNLLEKYNLDNNFRYIGLITHEEVASLIFHSIAVINPSKFEGRNVSVEQARSMGKQVILSDINIHKEQYSPRTNFFNPDHYKDLAIIIFNKWNKFKIKDEIKNRNITIKKNKNNLFEYYKNYEKIINYVLDAK